jgi:hypothetical protein
MAGTRKSRRGGHLGNVVTEEKVADLGRIEYFAIPSQTRLQDPNRPPRFLALREPPMDRKDFDHVQSEYARLARFGIDRHSFFTELERWEFVLILTSAGFFKVAYGRRQRKDTDADRTRRFMES